MVRHNTAQVRAVCLVILVTGVIVTAPWLQACRSVSSEPAVKVTAGQLYLEYRNNRRAADMKYRGETLEVTGTVNSIGRDLYGFPYVILTGGGEYDMFGVW